MKVILFPGASLMEITPLDDGIRVRCPGCGNEQEYHGTGDRAFAHADRCSVFARIEQALSASQRDEGKRG